MSKAEIAMEKQIDWPLFQRANASNPAQATTQWKPPVPAFGGNANTQVQQFPVFQPAEFSNFSSEPTALALTKTKAAPRNTLDPQIQLIDDKLTAKGIDGRGVMVGVMEPDVDERLNAGEDHAYLVSGIIGDLDTGVAPEANVKVFGVPDTLRVRSLRDKPDDLDRYLSQVVAGSLDEVTQKLNKIAASKEKGKYRDLRVMNLSIALNRVTLYESFSEQLSAYNPKTKKYLYPKLRREIYGSNKLSKAQRAQRLIDYIDNSLDQDRGFKKAMGRYQKATKQLAEQGVTMVVAVGNEHRILPKGVKLKPGAEFNFLCESKDVIAVAASDSRGTSRISDDTIGAFSSRGSKKWQPTVAAPGVNIRIQNPLMYSDPEFRRGSWSGTSAAAPYVAGVVALMLQKNPKLTSAQIKKILAASAIDTRAADVAEGAGMINPELAVNYAERMRRSA